MMLDLTNTDRYYDVDEVRYKYGIRHVKYQLAGHGQHPSRRQMDDIIGVIKQFKQNHPNQYIGIHCTHGFNRTGFIICSYLVECCNRYVGDAIADFAASRQNGIYRENVIEELYQRYDPTYLAVPMLLTIPSPPWHKEHRPQNNQMES